MYDAVVIGGGFYGCSIALWLRTRFERVLVLERESDLLARASFTNQARLHNGYHYPRSLNTAYSSHVNMPLFQQDYGGCVRPAFTKLYCIGRNNSKVNRRQFERFCRVVGLPYKVVRPEVAALFNSALVEAVYEVEESAFDALLLREALRQQLSAAAVDVRTSSAVRSVTSAAGDGHTVELAGHLSDAVRARRIFNCTYAGLKSITGLRDQCAAGIKYEVAELALVEPPSELRGFGVTLMDGPFFSVMPFPARRLYSLSHVRYTPHFSWTEGGNPYEILDRYPRRPRALSMIKDAQRYLPCLERCRWVESLFEIKTLLQRNELDDGRPILLERGQDPSIYSILGGKLDNIYDVIHRLEAMAF